MNTTQQTNEYGTLRNYLTGEIIRPATEDERDESREAGETGAILVDGITCYVEE